MKQAQEYSLHHYASHPMECSSMEEDDGGPWIRAEDYAELLLAAREMREVLRELGSGVIVSPASVRLLDCCPLCQGPRVTHHREEGKVRSKIDHRPDCRLARLIGGGK